MIITCPSCATRYEIPAKHLQPAGRMVRCTNCGHRWFVAHDGGSPQGADASEEPPQAAIAMTVPEEPPLHRAPMPDIAEEADDPFPAVAKRSTGATVGWLAVLLILLILTGLVLGRNELVALAPQTAPFYQRLGLPVVQAIGLELADVVSERLAEDEKDILRITGTVRNVAGVERMVPDLRVALLDAAREEVLVERVEMPQSLLADGADAQFSVDFVDPPASARNFSITFALED